LNTVFSPALFVRHRPPPVKTGGYSYLIRQLADIFFAFLASSLRPLRELLNQLITF
jgi:hypothetical protein